MSRRGALALGGTLAGTLAAANALPVEANANAAPDQLSATSDTAPANNGAATPDAIPASGELHQNAGGTHPSMTTNQGIVIADDEIRRSQRGGVSWERLSPLLNRWIPLPRVLHPYPMERFDATHPRRKPYA